MDMVSRHGQMALYMLDRGVMTKLMVKVDFNMLMETCMMESGKMIKLMEAEHILMLMEQGMRVNGKRIVSTVAVSKHGQMAQNTRDSILKEKNMELESCFFLMVALTKEILLTTISMVVELIDGRKENNTKEIGLKIKCMGKELSVGQTERNMMEIL